MSLHGNTRTDAAITPVRLRCEYLENPLGIDSKRPRLSWALAAEGRGNAQSAYQVLVAESEDTLDEQNAGIWNSGKVDSDQCIQVVMAGLLQESYHQYHPGHKRRFWKVRVWDRDDIASDWSETAWWEYGFMTQSAWKGRWIGLHTPPLSECEWFKHDQVAASEMTPVIYLRKEFKTGKTVKRARAYATALGMYELYLNGKCVGDSLFAPGWTDYHKRVQYQAHDITALLREGENAAAILLAPGWFSGRCGFSGFKVYGDRPHARVNLLLEYDDGSTEMIATDETWKASTGPMMMSDLYMGEIYDARIEMPGWNDVGFDDGGWRQADTQQWSSTSLVPQTSPAIRRIMEIRPVSVRATQDGGHIFDLGQNIAGHVRLRVKGKSGDKIVMEHREWLSRDGEQLFGYVDQGLAVDTYVCRGDAEEVFEPTFTYHGFRYIKIEGLSGSPTLDDLVGIVIHSDAPITGSFECSNEMINKVYEATLWSQRANFMSVPTDCPQRAERVGWTGDVQIFGRTACFNMDWSAFLSKWMTDILDAQGENGCFPDFAPRIPAGWNGDGAPGWAEVGIVIPWVLYTCYGDVRILEKSYHAMQRFMDYVLEGNPNYLHQQRVNNNVCDWLNMNAYTGWDLLGTAYWGYSCILMSKIAAVLGNEDDVAGYDDLHARIKKAFNEAYVSDDGKLLGENRGRSPWQKFEQIAETHNQTAYLLAFAFDLLNEENKQRADEHLMERLEARDWHLSTGFLGCPLLLPTLTKMGHLDIAYRLMLNEDCPSWGYMVLNGGTTMWERWDGWTEKDWARGSLNHFAFGCACEWLQTTVAGIDIDPDQPAYKNVIMRPRPGGGLSFAGATHDSMYGRIESRWEIDGGKFQWNIVIPPNTNATVHVPLGNGGEVLEGGVPAAEAEGVEFLREENGEYICRIASGSYQFMVKG